MNFKSTQSSAWSTIMSPVAANRRSLAANRKFSTNRNNQQEKQTKPLELNDFFLNEKIGSGSFGKVHKVKHKITEDIYAAKISNESLDSTNSDLITDISREVNIISKLDHPCCLRFILYSEKNFKNKPKPVIITEYASNGSLSDLINHDRKNANNRLFDDTLKLTIIYGIVSAMKYLHSNGVLHRDLKPDNILLDKNLIPKVADFGLSKSQIKSNKEAATETIISDIKGTPMYISPEIWEKYHYSKPGDVYAFGIVLFEIMTLQKPFTEGNIFSLALKIKNGDRPKFEVPIPDVYKSLIERCWSQDPNLRPTFSDILNELKTNHDFITEKVDEEKYWSFVQNIDQSKTTFDLNKTVISALDLIRHKKQVEQDQEFNDCYDEYSDKVKHFPLDLYLDLNEDNRNLVIDAESDDPKKQFELAQNLIEGRHNFQFNNRIGLIYLFESMNKGNLDSQLYYIKMLIKGRFIPKNHEKAKKMIEKYFNNDNPIYSYLYGKLLKNNKQYSISNEYFKKSFLEGYNDSLYEYTKLIQKVYCKPDPQENINDLYQKAINNGNIKAMFKYGIILKESAEINDKIKGNLLIKQAADKGCIKAMHYYGTNLYNKEQKDKTEDDKSIEYLMKASQEGDLTFNNYLKCSLNYQKT